MKKLLSKGFTFISLFSLLLGWRAITEKWDITEDEPYLFVKICDGERTTPFTNNLPEDDPLANTDLTRETIIQSVLDDINNLSTNFIRIEIFPEDENNPTSPNFSLARADSHTITLCSGSPSTPLAGGRAKITISGGKITECDIIITSEEEDDAKLWMGTFAHELGHCLGLNHPQDNVHAVMSYFSQGAYRFQHDDFLSLTSLYSTPSLGIKDKSTFGLKCSSE
jgi:hypothetical protein